MSIYYIIGGKRKSQGKNLNNFCVVCGGKYRLQRAHLWRYVDLHNKYKVPKYVIRIWRKKEYTWVWLCPRCHGILDSKKDKRVNEAVAKYVLENKEKYEGLKKLPLVFRKAIVDLLPDLRNYLGIQEDRATLCRGRPERLYAGDGECEGVCRFWHTPLSPQCENPARVNGGELC